MLSRAISNCTQRKLVSCRGFAAITNILGREIIDSRGNPTVEVDLTTSNGITVRASVPSGASTGIYEAHEWRDGGDRYNGKGVLGAVNHINNDLLELLKGQDVRDQQNVDRMMIELDGTENKSRLGANALLGVSLATAKAGARAKEVPLYRHFAELAGNPQDNVLPTPCFNVINGGEHAGNKLAFQEFFVIPTGAKTFKEAMEIGCRVFHCLKKIIATKFGGDATLIGDEGGFAPPCDVGTGLQMLTEATEAAGVQDVVEFGLDVAASEFYIDGKYDLDFKTKDETKNLDEVYTGQELADRYKELIRDYPIVTVEDPFDQDDWDSWSQLTAGTNVQIVGDDLTVTNPKRIKTAMEKESCNCLLLKVNQIGTISESIEAVKLSKQYGWGVMTSHRSGETEDDYIADLAVGLCTGQIKTGAPCRGERTSKYNQLLRIEEELGSDAEYAGSNFRNPPWMG